MKRHERLQTALAGGVPDRVPVSAWGHFYLRETSAEDLAAATVEFQQRFDWDFIKIHSRASYHVEGWGFRYEASRDASTLHTCTFSPIQQPEDWAKLQPLRVDCPPFTEQLDVLRRVRKAVGDQVPIIMTVFSPLDVADKLVDRNSSLLSEHIDSHPELVGNALGVIAESFAAFVRELVREGADGIYFTSKWANDKKLSAESYRSLARAHDMLVLDEARALWCNLLHLCEGPIHLQEMADYPVHVLHWDAEIPGNPAFGSQEAMHKHVLSGGVSSAVLARGTPELIRQCAQGVIHQTRGSGFILAPGCSAQMGKTSAENFQALRDAPNLM